MAVRRFSASRSPDACRFILKRCLHFASRSPFRPHRRSYLSQAAIDEQLDAGYVTAVVGGQEQDGLRDFIRGAGTAQGNIANRTVYKLIDLFLRHPKRCCNPVSG